MRRRPTKPPDQSAPVPLLAMTTMKALRNCAIGDVVRISGDDLRYVAWWVGDDRSGPVTLGRVKLTDADRRALPMILATKSLLQALTRDGGHQTFPGDQQVELLLPQGERVYAARALSTGNASSTDPLMP